LTVAEGEAAADAEEPKKGSKKKMIIMVVGFLLIALIAAKMTVLKPPPLTKAQMEAKEAATKYALEVKCAVANRVPLPKPPEGVKGTAATPDTTPAKLGSVLALDSVTVNLADGHFLKFGVGIQFAPGVVIETVKPENPGAAAVNYVLTQLRTKSTGDLGPKSLEPLQAQYGYAICSDEKMNFEGKILGIYFTDFVSQ
jgi:flagellar FliL protein